MSLQARGKTLRSQAQHLVVNLLDYFEREKEHGGPLLPLNCIQQVIINF